MVDEVFANPRLAQLYDPLEQDRPDLAVYIEIVDELGARSVLDVGCGTGTLPCLLAQRGVTVVGVDPATASLEVARRKPGADRVHWIAGEVPSLPPLQVDAVTMTGNVAQVFVTGDEWHAVLTGIRSALRPSGTLVFEVRDPEQEAWRTWTRADSFRSIDLDGVGRVESWVELTDVRPPLISFRWTFVFHADGTVLTSDSTLRFRSRAEIEASLDAAGYDVADVRDAPDRPGQELVFLATRSGAPSTRR